MLLSLNVLELSHNSPVCMCCNVYMCVVLEEIRKIINVQNIMEGKSKKTIPVFEVHKIISEYVICMIMCLQSIEAVALIPNNATLAIEAKDNSTLIATAGEKGKVYVLRYVDCVNQLYVYVYDLEYTTTRIKNPLNG